MQRLPVESTDIVSIGYDAKSRTLEIEFKEGRIYQYFDVEPDIYQRFTRAESYGEYFFASINKHYRYKRVNDAKKSQKLDKLAFVTANEYKFRDLQKALAEFDIEIERLELPVDEIQSHDTEKIALHKAKEAYKLAGRPVVVQDTFWNILALKGFPGAFMSYMCDWLRAEDLFALMQGKDERTIIRTHSVVYYDGKRSKIISKDFVGTLATEPRGESRYMIDTVVITAGQTKTNAEVR
jgi:non-canonical purine NTP pyrophosphatase (RdgB/HAM1 family)